MFLSLYGCYRIFSYGLALRVSRPNQRTDYALRNGLRRGQRLPDRGNRDSQFDHDPAKTAAGSVELEQADLPAS
jgi:hypothetical protein